MHKILWRFRNGRTRAEFTFDDDLDAVVTKCQTRMKTMRARGFVVYDKGQNVVRQWSVRAKGGHRKD